MIHFGLTKGTDIPPEQIEKIQRYDLQVQCVNQAYRYLSRRHHLEKELRLKLHRKYYPQETIDSTVRYLRERGYIDDKKFIHSFIREQAEQNKTGPLLIRQKLSFRGADSGDIQNALDTDYPEELERKNARSLFLKKNSQLRDLDPGKRKQKIIAFLQRRGYGWESIQAVLISIEMDENSK